MTSRRHIHKLAVCALCAKADIPEVEAIIRLLEPAIEREFRQVATDVLRELLVRLDALSDDLGAADVDVLVQAGARRSDVLEALLAGLLAIVTQGYGAFVSAGLRTQVEDAVDALFAFGAQEVGLPFEGPQADLLRQAAVGQLDALLRQTVIGQEPRLRELLQTYLTSAPAREAGATLAQAAGDSAMSGQQFQAELEDILVPLAAAGASVDAWAYLQQNVSATQASIEGGHRAFQAIAVGGKLGDGRTTAFCRWVHGRIIPLSRVQPQLDRLTGAGLAGDPAALRRLWPFLDSETARHGNELQWEMFFRRAGLPPYHFGCRTRVRPIRIGD